MDAFCGIVGQLDSAVCDSAMAAMERRLTRCGQSAHRLKGATYAIASTAPITPHPCLLDGIPRKTDGIPYTLDEIRQGCNPRAPHLDMRGEFAAAVGIDGGRAWWLLRDRLGRRPLYYYQGPGFLLFASEMRTLLAADLAPKRLNLSSVDRYLTLRCVPGPESILQGIFRVKPGYGIHYQDGRVSEKLLASLDLHATSLTRDDAADHLRELLTGALSSRSGGRLLWSSGINCAALAALADVREALHPIFVSIERSWQDEARLARESARRLDLPLETVAARRFTEEAFWSAVDCIGEPLADPSVLPLWLVLRTAAQESDALISGIGANELLGGYPRYRFLDRASGAKGFVPVSLLSGMLPELPPNAFVRRWSHYLAAIQDNYEAYLSLLSVFDRGERDELYTHAMKAALHEQGDPTLWMHPYFTENELTRNLLSLELSVGLPDLLLAKYSGIALGTGAAIEYPYLDDSLVDFAISLPPQYRFGVRSKPLLRLALKGVLPGRVRLRARRDFRIPQSGRVAQVIESIARQTVTPERVEASGLFRWNRVDQVLRSATHNVYRRRQFWSLLMFFAWYRDVMEH